MLIDLAMKIFNRLKIQIDITNDYWRHEFVLRSMPVFHYTPVNFFMFDSTL